MVDGACQARSSQWCPLTHAFLGIDSERDHCKMRVFVLTRRTREGPSNRPLFFSPCLSGSAPPSCQITYRSLLLFFFFQIVSSNPRCANRRWQTMLLTFSSPCLCSQYFIDYFFSWYLFMIIQTRNIEKRAFLLPDFEAFWA